MTAKEREEYKEKRKSKKAGKKAGKSVIVTKLTDDETFVKRQLERKPYIETDTDKYGNILVDFCLGSNIDEAGEVCAKLFKMRDEFEKKLDCVL